MLKIRCGLVSLAVLATGLLSAAPAEAGFSLLSTRAGTDSFNWGQLGPNFTPVPSPSNVTSAGGVVGSVSDTGFLQRYDQQNGWSGNFTIGDKLLYSAVNGSSLTVKTGSTLDSVGGAQIQSANIGSFTAQVEALDAGGLVLATFTDSNGFSSAAADNSAIFIGVRGTAGSTFNALRFSITANGTNGFAINQFSFTPSGAAPPVTATPLPPTLVAALLGVVGLGGASLRRRLNVA